MTVNSVTKSHVKISSHNSWETKCYDFKGLLNVQLQSLEVLQSVMICIQRYQLNSGQ